MRKYGVPLLSTKRLYCMISSLAMHASNGTPGGKAGTITPAFSRTTHGAYSNNDFRTCCILIAVYLVDLLSESILYNMQSKTTILRPYPMRFLVFLHQSFPDGPHPGTLAINVHWNGTKKQSKLDYSQGHEDHPRPINLHPVDNKQGEN